MPLQLGRYSMTAHENGHHGSHLGSWLISMNDWRIPSSRTCSPSNTAGGGRTRSSTEHAAVAHQPTSSVARKKRRHRSSVLLALLCPTLVSCQVVQCDPRDQAWTVESTADATSLLNALLCADGIFSVNWKGHVIVEETLYVGNNTSLVITGGAGLDAVVDGNSATRLFFMEDASLRLTNMTITRANEDSAEGGAIFAKGSRIEFDGTMVLSDNHAEYAGGAIRITGGSSLSWAGNITFDRNTVKTGDGGALSADSSVVHGDGSALFVNNIAGKASGAVKLAQSSLYLNGNTNFENNSANGYGGAMYAIDESDLKFSGTTVARGNYAGTGGGAFSYYNSTVEFDGTVEFFDNHAEVEGGGVRITGGSDLSWTGNVTFDGNSVNTSDGGALLANLGSVHGGGITFFANNSAGEDAGAVLLASSSMHLTGDMIFANNNANGYGGAMYAIYESDLKFSGTTVARGNYAGTGGGAFSYYNSTVEFDGTVEFFDNHAEVEGGGVRITGGSDLSWTGNVTFDGNSVNTSDGGALLANLGSVHGGGITFFVNNSAGEDAGAVKLTSSSMHLNGDIVFANNNANKYGGAIYARYESDVEFKGTAVASNNHAESEGGAIRLSSDCRLSWTGNVTFESNTVITDDGGALSADSSVVLGDGATLFVGNFAGEDAGAVRLAWSSMNLRGITMMVNNTASRAAGAVFAADGSEMEFGGVMEARGNHAGTVGGAFRLAGSSQVTTTMRWAGSATIENNVAGTRGGGLSIGDQCSVSWTGNTTFNYNIARTDGGAVDISGDSALTVEGSTSFHGNLAEDAGGAVYSLSNVGGQSYSGVVFEYNSAARGGAIATFSTGEETSNTYTDCAFKGNDAKATGGAVEAAAGQDEFRDSKFLGNSAGVGGALRLSGSASIVNVSFEENRAWTEGPAISNIGVVTGMDNVSFNGNTFVCGSGEFLEYVEKENDTARYSTVCSGCPAWISCESCGIAEGTLNPECKEVLEHTSAETGTTLETLDIDKGYWRATIVSKEILECYNEEACRGGETGTSAFCADGYMGPYCAVCDEGYSATLAFTCGKCSGSRRMGVLMVAATILVFTATVVGSLVAYLVSSESAMVGRHRLVNRMILALPLQSVKILVVVWQILTQFTSVATVTYPEIYEQFLRAIDVINLDLGWMVSAGCLWPGIDYHDRLLFGTLGPLLTLVLLGATYAVALRRTRAAPNLEGRRRVRKVYAGLMIAVYPLGIPLFYGILLSRIRGTVRHDAGSSLETTIGSSTTALWTPYRPECFYYEIVECFRRISLTGIIVFIYPGAAAQIAVTLMVSFAFFVVSEVLMPYKEASDTWLSRGGHVVVFCSFFAALLYKVDVSNERAASQEVFAGVLVAAHAWLILVVVLNSVGMWIQHYRNANEDHFPRSRCGGPHPGQRKSSLVLLDERELPMQRVEEDLR